MRITTENSLDYCYFPISSLQVHLTIQASHDARIALRTHLEDDSDVYEIFLGRCGNTMSAIRKNNIEPNVVEMETRDLLSDEENRSFWIRWGWYNGYLSVGWRGSNQCMTYRDKDPFVINYIGVSTAYGVTGKWMLYEMQSHCLGIRQQLLETNDYWIDYNDDEGTPKNAVPVSEGDTYVGRAYHKGSITPGNIRDGVCILPWGGRSHEKKRFQILCGTNINWVKSWSGSVSLHALAGGETEDSYPLFIGRVCVEDTYYVGKIQPNHQVCYIPLNNQEKAYKEYETLVVNYSPIIEYVGR